MNGKLLGMRVRFVGAYVESDGAGRLPAGSGEIVHVSGHAGTNSLRAEVIVVVLMDSGRLLTAAVDRLIAEDK